MATTIASEIDVGGLWEIGVMFPMRNPNMERYEQHFTLYRDVNAEVSTIFIYDEVGRFKINSFILIGPSSDPSRNIGGELLYFDNYEVFKIDNMFTNPFEPNVYGIVLGSAAPSMPSKLQNAYLAGDNITIRTLPESWNFLSTGDFSSISPLLNPVKDSMFEYLRHDSLDGFKGFSHLIKCDEFPTSDVDVGIVQEFRGRGRYLLNKIAGSNVRMSCWMKAGLAKGEATVLFGDDIDENIAGPKDNDIDEGFGFTGGMEMSNSIDENKVAGAGTSSGYMTPILRASFYSDTAFSNLLDDYSESPGEIQMATQNMFVERVFGISDLAVTGRFSAYCLFESNSALQDMEFYVDDMIIEHCVGTSKEEEGFYQFDINPEIGMSIQNQSSHKSSTELLGESVQHASIDPLAKLKISTVFKNRPGYFIEDMRKMEAWNRQGYPIVLRPKMPGILPNVILCRMTVDSPNYVSGRAGTEKADVKIEFEEITA